MRQKVVIKLYINGNDQKSRTKAFKIAVSQPGVESTAIKEGENYELEVVGEHIDAVVLTKSLRKKLGQAQLVSVGPVNARPQASGVAAQLPQPLYLGVPEYQFYHEVPDPNPECCSIM